MKSDLSPSKISRTSFGKSILLNDHPDLNVIRKAFYLAERVRLIEKELSVFEKAEQFIYDVLPL